MARQGTGKKRGPKKGYKQSKSHIAKRRKALEAAWSSGKFQNRKKRKSSGRKVVTQKPVATKRIKRETSAQRARRRKAYKLAERSRRKRR